MKARELEGKTIARVGQGFRETNTGKTWCLDYIQFTDGTTVRFRVLETEGLYYEIEPRYPAHGPDPDHERPAAKPKPARGTI